MSEEKMMDYDPNMVLCGRKAKQIVELVFADWEYRSTHAVTIVGNCRGMSVIDSAVERLFEELYDEDRGHATLVLTNADGDTLTDDEGEDEDWLKSKVISARILSIEPDGRFW